MSDFPFHSGELVLPHALQAILDHGPCRSCPFPGVRDMLGCHVQGAASRGLLGSLPQHLPVTPFSESSLTHGVVTFPSPPAPQIALTRSPLSDGQREKSPCCRNNWISAFRRLRDKRVSCRLWISGEVPAPASWEGCLHLPLCRWFVTGPDAHFP